MFEVDPSIGANAAAARNAFAAASNGRLATKFEQAYEEWRAHAKALEQQLADAQARIAELELALAVKTASAAGSVAVVEAFKASHPQSPLLVQDGTFRNGSMRRRSNVIWAKAFDEVARKLGISNPEAHRIS